MTTYLVLSIDRHTGHIGLVAETNDDKEAKRKATASAGALNRKVTVVRVVGSAYPGWIEGE